MQGRTRVSAPADKIRTQTKIPRVHKKLRGFLCLIIQTLLPQNFLLQKFRTLLQALPPLCA